MKKNQKNKEQIAVLFSKNEIDADLIEYGGNYVYVRLYDKYYLYNTRVGIVYKFEPEYKYLYSTDYMHYMLFNNYYQNCEGYEELTENEFVKATSNNDEPVAYKDEKGYYLVYESTAAFCDKKSLTWRKIEKQKIDVNSLELILVEEMLKNVSVLQNKNWQKFLANGGKFDIDPFDEGEK